MDSLPFEILYEDSDLIIVNKPSGWFVHGTDLDRQAEEVLVPFLRNYVGDHVYPAHRIDRKTSGIVLFSKNRETHIKLRNSFELQEVFKLYLAITRGYIVEPLKIDYPLTNDSGKTQDALTEIFPIDNAEISIPFGKHATSRYSLVMAKPITGRQHQIRKHLKHIFHPILGDRPHGCNKQNRFMLAQFNLSQMLLHAYQIAFVHPHTQKHIHITCQPSAVFVAMAGNLTLDLPKALDTKHYFQPDLNPL